MKSYHDSYRYSSIKFNDFLMTFPRHILTFLVCHRELKPPDLLFAVSDLYDTPEKSIYDVKKSLNFIDEYLYEP